MVVPPVTGRPRGRASEVSGTSEAENLLEGRVWGRREKGGRWCEAGAAGPRANMACTFHPSVANQSVVAVRPVRPDSAPTTPTAAPPPTSSRAITTSTSTASGTGRGSTTRSAAATEALCQGPHVG